MTPERLQTVSCTVAYRSAGEGNARARLAGSARHSVQHRRKARDGIVAPKGYGVSVTTMVGSPNR